MTPSKRPPKPEDQYQLALRKLMAAVVPIMELVEQVDSRSLAADGPVTPFGQEIDVAERVRLDELVGKLYQTVESSAALRTVRKEETPAVRAKDG